MVKNAWGELRSLTVICLALIILTGRPAHAYIDPGTGSFVLQAAVAGLLGVAFAIKSTWKGLSRAAARILLRRHSRAG